MSWDWDSNTLAALRAFLASRGILDGELTARRIGDGHSNLTFLVSDGERDVVVRRPPPPPLPPGANDMLREARILTALGRTAVPVPQVLATAKADEVLDVPFYVMEFVGGHIVTTEVPAEFTSPAARRRLGESMVDTLAELHAVDYRAAGLGDLGRPEGFNERHLRRMARLVADEAGAPPPAFAAIQAWLEGNVPTESGAAIVHNDYRIGNLVIGQGAPERIAAVLDWELTTLGDPLFDVGYFLASVPEPGRPLTPTEALGTAMLEEGFPTRAELAARYAVRSGRDLGSLHWYTALALWKLAVLYEYSRRRFELGIGDEYYADPRLVHAFLAEAHSLAGLPAPTAAPSP